MVSSEGPCPGSGSSLRTAHVSGGKYSEQAKYALSLLREARKQRGKQREARKHQGKQREPRKPRDPSLMRETKPTNQVY